VNSKIGRRIAVVLSIILCGELVWLAQLTLLPRFQRPPFNAVRVSRLSLYSTMQYKGCKPMSRSLVSLPTTNSRIYDLEKFAAWHGKHRMTVEYDSPGGRVYAVSTVSSRHATFACGYLSVYGQEVAAHPGWWRIKLSVGDHMLKSKSFKIHRVQPDPQLLIPPFICRSGCLATLRKSSAIQPRKRFKARSSLVAFLRRYPDLRIVTIVGPLRTTIKKD
jgi:hypothetical protein